MRSATERPRDAIGPRRFALVLALSPVLLTLPGGARAEGDPPAGNGPVAPVPFEERVNRAIESGVDWLKKDQQENGAFTYRTNSFGGHPDRGPKDEMWAGGPWQKGANALAVYTLAACDVPPDDTVLVKGLRRVREDWRSRKIPDNQIDELLLRDGISTYYVSLALMALDALHNRGVSPMGKGPPVREKGGKQRGAVPAEDIAWAAELAEWLRLAQDPGKDAPIDSPGGSRKKPPPSQPVPTGDVPDRGDGGGFSYESPARAEGYHDHSNSQFAVLGLKAASRLGVRVRDATWLRALRHFLAVQETSGPEVPRVDAPDAGDPRPRKPGGDRVTVALDREKDQARGWGYMCANSRASAERLGLQGLNDRMEKPGRSMTAGGVSSLVICRSELEGVAALSPGLRRITEKGIRDGLAFLALHFDDDESLVRMPGGEEADPPAKARPESPMGGAFDDFYYAYGLERACILGGVVRIGSHDWYREGADLILRRQREDGSFLGKNRNNGNGTDLIDTCFALLFLKRAVFRVPDRRVATRASSFEDLFARYLAADAVMRVTMVPGFVELGTEVVPKLLFLLDDDGLAERTAAHEVLRASTGRDFGFDPAAPPERRAPAVDAWQAWWLGCRARLAADPAAGRFRER